MSYQGGMNWQQDCAASSPSRGGKERGPELDPATVYVLCVVTYKTTKVNELHGFPLKFIFYN